MLTKEGNTKESSHSRPNGERLLMTLTKVMSFEMRKVAQIEGNQVRTKKYIPSS